MTMDREKLKRLEELLLAYGADLTRWPENERAGYAPLLDFEAGSRLLDETLALDALLHGAARGEVDVPAPAALVDRVMAQLPLKHSTPAVTGDTATVEDLTAHRSRSAQRSWSRNIERTAAAALMAASLILGVFVGASGRMESTVATLGDLAGLNVRGTVVQMSALDDALSTQDEEEQL